MGLFSGFKENEGFSLDIEGNYIGVIVRKIIGPRSKREAYFEVIGISSLDKFCLRYCDGMYLIRDGLEVGVREIRNSSDKVDLHIRTPYRIEKKMFSL